MGLILSGFRKKKSAIETLEKLENDIREIEENRSFAQRRREKIMKTLFLYSVGFYVLCGIVFYFQFTSTLKGKLLYLIPLALSPLLLYIISKIISWYYVRLIKKNQFKLNEMKKMKKQILEEVMDKETYKVAKEILNKFSNENITNSTMQLTPAKPDPGLRRRIIGAENMPNQPQSHNPQPMRTMGRGQPIPSSPQIRASSPNTVPARPIPGASMMRLPAPVLPRDRSYIDRVIEYLIGDGPNNRYALICSRCHSHNGMALKEEFEYIGFKCSYCFFYNPARKVRPQAPKLDAPPTSSADNESDSDSNSSVGSEVIEGNESTTGNSTVDLRKETVEQTPEVPPSPVQIFKVESNNSEAPVDSEVAETPAPDDDD